MQGSRPRLLRKRPVRWFLAAVAAVFLLPQVLPPRFFFDGPEAYARRAEASFHGRLLRRNGMEALWTFDEPGARGWFAETKTLRTENPPDDAAVPYRDVAPGIELVPGRHGLACRFPGRDDAFVRSGHIWNGKSAGFSVALWAKLEPLPARQDLFFSSEGGAWGFRLDAGRLFFDVKAESGSVSVSCPFDRFGEWVHLAAVSDPASGRLVLYADGVPAGERPAPGFAPKDWPLAFADGSRYKVRETVHGDLDDAGVWNRALSAAEVSRIATSRHGLARLLSGPGPRLRLALARAWRDGMGALGRLAIRLPRVRGARPEDEPPLVSLYLADGAARRLARAHGRALRSGVLSKAEAKPVRGHLAVGGAVAAVRVAPFGVPTFYPESGRMAYSVVPEDPEATLPGGFRRIVLAPPETSGWAVPLAESLVAEETGLPLAPRCTPVSLRVNGRDAGAFLLRDFSLGGTAPAAGFPAKRMFGPFQGVWAAWSEERLVRPAGLSPAVADAVRTFFPGDRLDALLDRLDRRAAPLAGDARSPVSGRHRESRLAAAAAELARLGGNPAGAADAFLREEILLGPNPSAFRVVGDLDFGTFRKNLPPGLSVRFSSRSPEWIDDEGRVLRRPADAPVRVGFEAALEDAAGNRDVRRLEFRLMPEDVRVPAVFVWTGAWHDKLWRSDAAVSFFAAGPASAEPDRTLQATVPGGGGVRWRGNSSFLKMNEKKLLSVETDAPHGLFPGSPTRKLLQINAHSDRLHLFNSLAYEIFRAAPGGRNKAPRIVRTEIYLNGVYRGLAEWAERIDADLVGVPDAVFFRHSVGRPRIPQTRQIRPSTADEDFEDRYRALLDLFAEEPSPGWAERVERAFDLDNAADCQLLVNLFQNTNVGAFDFPFMEYLCWNPSEDRWSHVPWDYDIALPFTGEWFASLTDRKLVRGMPGWPGRLAARWRAWRANAASDEALAAAFDRLMDGVRGYLADEIRLYDGVGDADAWIEEEAAHFRAMLLEEAKLLDETFDSVTPDAGEPAGQDRD